MTKSELKELIKECILEKTNEDYKPILDKTSSIAKKLYNSKFKSKSKNLSNTPEIEILDESHTATIVIKLVDDAKNIDDSDISIIKDFKSELEKTLSNDKSIPKHHVTIYKRKWEVNIVFVKRYIDTAIVY